MVMEGRPAGLIEEEARLALELVLDELASALRRAEPGLVAAARAR